MDAAGPARRVHRDGVVADRDVKHGPQYDLGLALPVHASLSQPQQELIKPTGGGLANLQPTHAG